MEFRIGLGLGLDLILDVYIIFSLWFFFLQIEMERVWAMEEKGCNLWAFIIHERFCLCDIIYAFLLVFIFRLNITEEDFLFLPLKRFFYFFLGIITASKERTKIWNILCLYYLKIKIFFLKIVNFSFK